MEKLGSELSDLRQGIASHISLCASGATINQFLPPLLARYEELHPQIHVDLEEQVSGAVVANLREGRADIAVFVEGPDTTGLDVRLFRRDELVLVLPARHPLCSSDEPLSFVDILDEKLISLTAGAAVLEIQQQAAFAANRPLKLRMQVRSFEAVCNMVSSGLGIALLPRGACLPIAASALKLRLRPLKDAWAHRSMFVATMAGQVDERIASLRDFLLPQPPGRKKARQGVTVPKK